MACPTCDHTLQGLGGRWFWCPRCGTLKCEGGVPEYDQPMLVRRVLKARCWFSAMDLIQGGIDDCLPLDANQLGGDTKIIETKETP